MLSPPSRMWSPTATRSQRERAVLLADRDEPEVGGAAADVAHQHDVADLHAACARRRPARRARRRTPPAALRAACTLRQAGLRAPPRRSARGPPRRTRRHGQQHVLLGERRVVVAVRVRPRPRAGARGSRADASTRARRGDTSSGRLPRQDVGGRGRRPRARATTSPTPPAGPESRRRACARARRPPRRPRRPRAARAPRPRSPPDPAGTGTTAGACGAATSPGLTSCGDALHIGAASSPALVSTSASAQFVVPRSMPTMNRASTSADFHLGRRHDLPRSRGGQAAAAPAGRRASRGGARCRGSSPAGPRCRRA